MCSGSCAKCLGITLIPLAILSILANILLFFPAGKVAENNSHITPEVFYLGGLLGSGLLGNPVQPKNSSRAYFQKDAPKTTREPGATKELIEGLLPKICAHVNKPDTLRKLKMIFPALVFLGMKKNDCCGCCGNESCGKRFASFSSILFAAIGFVGAAYNFIISAVAINKGPVCYLGKVNGTDFWDYPFSDGKYLGNHTLWKDCKTYTKDKTTFETEIIITWNLTLFSMLLIMGGVQAVLCAIQAINGLIGTICGDCKCCGCCGNDGPV